jgi:hypothetical protein
MEAEDRRGQGQDGELIWDGRCWSIRIGAGELPPPLRDAVQGRESGWGVGALADGVVAVSCSALATRPPDVGRHSPVTISAE